MKQQYDDTFLARWLSGELSSDELQGFEKSEDFSKYTQIIDTLDSAQLPEFDIENSFQATLEKITAQQTVLKKKRVIPLWSYVVAASIAALIFVYSFYFTTTTITTQFAEKTKFELPDGSQVTLNAGSSVSFKKYGWDSNRTLYIEGEAYFEVNKGSTFSVKNKKGVIVTVLGTEFTVNSRENLYNIICYEGKVRVQLHPDLKDLSAGDALIVNNGKVEKYKIEEEKPTWLTQQSSFKNTSIIEVIEELERQYNIVITGKEKIKPASFTGSFNHDNLDQALQIVFVAMDISYTKDAKGNVVIQNK